MPNTELLRKHLLREGHINKRELLQLLNAVRDILSMYHHCLFNPFVKYRKGTKRHENQGTSYHRWRYPWTILRYDSHV